MVIERGLSPSEVGRQLTIPTGTVVTWVRRAVKESSTGTASPGASSMATMLVENAQVRRELNEARMERDILKKRRRTLQGSHCTIRIYEK